MIKKKAKLEKSASITMAQIEADKEELVFTTDQFSFSSRDLSRLIQKTLNNLGYIETARKLEEESGLSLSSKTAVQFFAALELGSLNDAVSLCDHLSFSSLTTCEVKMMLIELKYFEYIRSGSVGEALTCLRCELGSNQGVDPNRLGVLATFLAAPNAWENSHEFHSSRESLSAWLKSYISRDEIFDDFRLEELLEQALKWQSNLKKSSKNDINPIPGPGGVSSLLYDLPGAVKPSARIPDKCFAEIPHSQDVWCISFSPCGNMLATALSNGSVTVWNLEQNVSFTKLFTCRGASAAPIQLQWNSASNFLLCCQQSSVVCLWKVNPSVLRAEIPNELDSENFHHQLGCTIVYAGFACIAGLEVIVTCSRDNLIYVRDLDDNVLFTHVGKEGGVVNCALLLNAPLPSKSHNDKCYRGSDIKYCWQRPDKNDSSNPSKSRGSLESGNMLKLLVANSKDNAISLYSLVHCKGTTDREHEIKIEPLSSIKIGSPVISLSSFLNSGCFASGDEPIALVTVLGGAITTILIKDGQLVYQHLNDKDVKHVPQNRFVVKPSIDPSGSYMACGGEDGVVRIWDNRNGRLVSAFTSHCGHVSEVSWFYNSRGFLLLASASDDCTARIWAPSELITPAVEASTSDHAYCALFCE